MNAVRAVEVALATFDLRHAETLRRVVLDRATRPSGYRPGDLWWLFELEADVVRAEAQLRDARASRDGERT